MAPLLKNLLGNSSRNREIAEDNRAILQEMREERQRFEALVKASGAAADRLDQLGEPIAKVACDIDAVSARIAEVEQRLETTETLAARIQVLAERSDGLAEGQQRAEAQFASVREDSQQTRETFEDLREKVDLAVDLEDRLEKFLEIEKPFQVLLGEAEAVRSQVEGTNQHLGRLREHNERLVDAHKLALAKMEALDRRREEFSRDLQDKERRVVRIEESVRELDGVRSTVDGVKRELGTLKALAESLAHKTTALEAQREAVERALSQAEILEQAMRQIDSGIRQQRDNARSLSSMQEEVAGLRTLHEEVVARSGEIAQLQRQTEEQSVATRHELAAAREETRNAVERFDFESKGLEAINQRVADLRGALADFENRYQGLRESSQTVRELNSRTQAVTGQLQKLMAEAGRIDQELNKLPALRRELEEARSSASELGPQVARIEEARPAVDAILRDFERLNGTHAMVKDTLEQTKIAHDEIARMRQSQSSIRDWMVDNERSLREMRDQVIGLQDLAPSLELTQKQTQRISESMEAIESRKELVEDLQRRLTDLGAVGSALDERGKQLLARMDTADQRFIALAEHAEEADRISKSVADVSARVNESTRKAEAIGETIATFEARCESVEGIAERTGVLREEIEQRQRALEEAAGNLERVSELRQEAATSAQQLDRLAKRFARSLTAAEGRAASVDELSTRLEDRAANLQIVDTRLDEFEERLAKWETVDEEVSRSLEQISARLGTVKTLSSDLDRMVVMAEKTSTDVRTITSAHREIAQSRDLLDEVKGRLQEIQGTVTALDERRRQMTQAEERLARAEGFLVDVQSSLEALQKQKVIVDQAVEKAGSLRVLLKQAEAMIEGLRDERQMSASVEDAISIVRDADRDDDPDADAGSEAKAA